MAEKILIPLDGSRVGEAALPYVEELISKLSPRVKVELTLLQIVSLLTHYVATGEATVPVVYTEREIADRIAMRDFFVEEILERGELLYG